MHFPKECKFPMDVECKIFGPDQNITTKTAYESQKVTTDSTYPFRILFMER